MSRWPATEAAPGCLDLDPLSRGRLSLEGLSLGDAFGEQFFASSRPISDCVRERRLPPAPWHYTDDTIMACSILEVLASASHIDQDLLAARFAERYRQAPGRGYGAMAHKILRALAAGQDWRRVSAAAFGGQGSMGNGAAMRVAPVGAYYASDPQRVAREAARSAEVTHAHAEGIAGAIAVAAAAAQAARGIRSRSEILEAALAAVPAGETATGLRRALDLGFDVEPPRAASVLGSGWRVTAPDTVPFALWCAARSAGDFQEAMWTVVAGGGDLDTNCAIVGGIVVLSDAGRSLPALWLERRERLPTLGLS
ncbi:MAG: ADP-ribosylglycohydrolase family protein [Candidatus Dadabacteria bacterium]|nr:MAG: ADP-ribosylglycohydrolase family protein [Candidatus Dadabacteria bacterium]